MSQKTEKPPSNPTFPEIAIGHVLIDDSHDSDECILFPRDSGEDRLETTWIHAQEGGYVSVRDAR